MALKAMKLSHQAWTLIAVPLVFELVFVCVLVGLLNQAEVEAAREAHARAILAETTALSEIFYEQAITAVALGMMKGSMLEERYNRNMEAISREVQVLKRLTKDDPKVAPAAQKIESESNALLKLFAEARRESSDPTFLFKAKDYRQTIKAHADVLLSAIKTIGHQQERFVAEPSKEAQIRKWVQALMYGGIFTNVLLAAFLAFYFNQSTGSRLRVLMENIQRLVKKEELCTPLGGKDELGELDSVFHDMAKALEEADRKQREIEAMKQEFLNVVSHDLRTPLTSIQSAMQLLLAGVRGPLSEGAIQDIESAERSLERLIRLINDLLDVAKMEAGKWDLHPDWHDLPDVVERCTSSIAALLKAKSVTIETEIPQLRVFCDSDRLVQVIINLLSNAVKISPKGSTVKITASKTETAWQLNIIDRGTGIPANAIATIFDRFEQVKGTKGGSGLGLTICKAIVEAHNGEIGVESEEGKGSRFWFRIPHSPTPETSVEMENADAVPTLADA